MSTEVYYIVAKDKDTGNICYCPCSKEFFEDSDVEAVRYILNALVQRLQTSGSRCRFRLFEPFLPINSDDSIFDIISKSISFPILYWGDK